MLSGGKCIATEERISKIFNNCFNRTAENVNIPFWPQNTESLFDPVNIASRKYSSHPSIKTIKSGGRVETQLLPLTEDIVVTEIMVLSSSKNVSGSIPIKILKLVACEWAPVLSTLFNDAI